MLRVLLVDDEEHALDELQYLLKKELGVSVVGVFTDPIDAIERIGEINPDVVFLDIDMPLLNGLNAAMEISAKDMGIDIVFVTAHNNYAVNAFDVNASDYLLKPLDKERLKKTLERLNVSRNKTKTDQKPDENKMNSWEKDYRPNLDKLSVLDEDEIILLKAKEVLFVEVQQRNTFITTKNKKYKSRDSLDLWESKLKKFGFFRCHRSFLVNLWMVNKICPLFNNSYILRLEDSQYEIPISRNYIKELKEILVNK